jgi:metal-responsive CopG/Arc/MetJ family transcriptional regulator
VEGEIRISVMIPQELYEILRRMSFEGRITQKDIIVNALIQYIHSKDS